MKLWSAGAILDDASPLIGANDQALEHGLGLFETLRTWNGNPILLDRHLARMIGSAQALRLPIDADALPDAEAVGLLLREAGSALDSVLRITLSGAVDGRTPGRIWMRARPLPPPTADRGVVLILGGFGLSFFDPLSRHKTLNYWSKRLAADRAAALGADDALLGTPDGRVWESTRANLFLAVDGELVTPGLEGPILPGIQRALVIELAETLGLSVRERNVYSWDVDRADEVFLTNSVRGIVPVGHTPGGSIRAPGSLTKSLLREYSRWLHDRREKPL